MLLHIQMESNSQTVVSARRTANELLIDSPECSGRLCQQPECFFRFRMDDQNEFLWSYSVLLDISWFE